MSMHQTLNFLEILDGEIKRSHQNTPKPTIRQRISTKRGRFPYAKAVMFDDRQQQYRKKDLYPRWLTKRQDFLDFMYKNYEKKLMSIPKICEKEYRASDQKYFVGLYLQQHPLFADLPQVVIDLILMNLKTRYVKVGEIIHPGGPPAFMAVIFAGVAGYRKGKDTVICQKNSVIMASAFTGQQHEPISCRQQAVLLTLDVNIYDTLVKKLRDDIEMRSRDQISDLLKSTFFFELHLKDKKSQAFYENCQLRFYFDGQVIAQAGSDVPFFSLIFKGQVIQQNHIYIRQHNKWPLPYRKWQVRAVYNSYHKQHVLKRFKFFGDEEITTNSKYKSKYIAKGWVALFTMDAQKFIDCLGVEQSKRLKKYRNQHIDINYGQFELNVRKRVRSLSQQRNIVKKAIGDSLAHRDNLTPRRLSIIGKFQKTMLNKTFFQKGSERDL